MVFSMLYIIACGNSSDQNKGNSKNLITDQSSFNPKTGEFSPDPFTVALWHFNPIKGELVNDSSTHDNSGLANNTHWTRGRFGSGIQFDGSKSYVEIESKESLTPKNAITIEMWVFIEQKQLQSYPALISKDSVFDGSGKPSYEIYLNNQPDEDFPFQIVFRINTSDGEMALPTEVQWQNLSDQKWHYIAASYDGKLMKFYIDGKLIKFKNHKGTIVSTKQPLHLSRKYEENKNIFNGRIDEVRISSVARSEKAIQQYWASVNHLPIP